MSHYLLDVKGLLCPMPVIRLGEQARQLSAGDVIEIQATDPGVKADVPAWCRVHGHNVLEQSEQDDVVTILVELGE